MRIAEVVLNDDSIDIRFSDDHRSSYSAAKLRQAAECPFTQELVGIRVPWAASLKLLPWHDLAVLKENPSALLDLLNDLARLGFALVRNVAPVHQGSREFLNLLGPVNTNGFE